jgi:hypothetical protein
LINACSIKVQQPDHTWPTASNPTHRRDLGLLDRRAWLRDAGCWSENGLQLMRRMDLPREWWADCNDRSSQAEATTR